MSERDDDEEYRALFEAHQPFIQRTLVTVARVLRLGADSGEFVSWAYGRVFDDGRYTVLRKWRRESKLTTYLTVVLTNYGREFRAQRWGRWRPSAAALRLGPVAVRLEQLVFRDALPLAQAAEVLRDQMDPTLTDRDLARVLAQLPDRRRAVAEREVPIEAIPDGKSADEIVVDTDLSAERRAAFAALFAAIGRLEPEERLVIRMHFLQGRSLADVARALDVPQKPLYRVKDRALAKLQRDLLAAGFPPERVRHLLGGAFAPDELRDDDYDDPAGGAVGGRDTRGPRPSNDACDSNPPEDPSASSASDRPGSSEP